ncbi:aminotransferase class V-fold PLP-dependent enzyme [Paenibacillus marinisediminis]
MGDCSSIVYLDHAATSWPKPPAVLDAMTRTLMEEGANPGRGGHRMAMYAGKRLMRTRMVLAELFNIANPLDIAFTLNTTMALNMAIHGYVREGDHVVATGIEHNAVRRPLEWLKKNKRVRVTYVAADSMGMLDLEEMERAIQPDTRLVVCNHSSNLFGSILPIQEIAALAHAHDAKLLVDAAQSAGLLPIDVQRMGIDMLAFPGHKGLLGPMGTGGLYIHPSIDVEPIIQGGTGSHSEDPEQPITRPDRYEAGTPNTVGIAGLEAGVRYILHESVENLYNKEWALTQLLMEGIHAIPSLEALGPPIGEARTGIVSIRSSVMDSAALAFQLDRTYGIAARSGYHCTPLAHELAGTLGEGAVRLSVGWNTTTEHIEYALNALRQLSQT